MATTNVTQQPKLSQIFKWGDSYGSLLLGIAVVFIAALGFVFITQFRHAQPVAQPKLRREVTSAKTVRLPAKTTQPNITAQTVYSVQPGEGLWQIAVKEYNDGYKWTQIAKANNLTNPGLIYKGQQLIIPSVVAQTSQTLAATLPTTVVYKTLPTMQITQNPATPEPVTTATSETSSETITGDSYTVQHGDSLWSIALRAYRNGDKWPEIARMNNLANPGLIHSGNVLKLPRGNS